MKGYCSWSKNPSKHLAKHLPNPTREAIGSLIHWHLGFQQIPIPLLQTDKE